MDLDILRNRISEVVSLVGEKHYSIKIKKDAELMAELSAATAEYTDQSLNIPEMVSVILHKQSPICIRGNRRKFKNIKIGFVNCGMAGKCECAREAVSQSCKDTISKRSVQQQQEINTKRESTVLNKYGARNVSNVMEISEKRQNTIAERYGMRSILQSTSIKEAGMLAKYGVKNAQELDTTKIKSTATSLSRYGYVHPMQNSEIRDKAHTNRDRTFLSELTSKAKLKVGYNNILHNVPDGIEPHFGLEDYRGIHDRHKHFHYDWKCTQCGLVFTRTLAHFEDIKCPTCRPSVYQSQPERDLAEIIRSWGLEVEPNNKKIINPYELDLVIHEKKVAIEYCGLYYHSERDKNSTLKGKLQNYHLEKLERCLNKGYHLITLFSDEWLQKRLIVESRLKSILGCANRGYGARQLSIESIKWINARIFLNEYHLQGAGAPTTFKYGAFDKDNHLCAVMTFSRHLDEYELVRFATDGRLYPGLASRLLHRFIRDHSPQIITSFADRRWSTGNLYKTLGFELTKISRPSYSYTEDYETRYHKSHFRLASIWKRFDVDRSLSERDAMFSLGFDRIWDCGTLKFELVLV